VTPRVGVCDYGVGNLRSVERALVKAGASVCVSADPAEIDGCDGVVLPGVGAFAAASAVLRDRGLDRAVRAAAARGLPVCWAFVLATSFSSTTATKATAAKAWACCRGL
jgi:glutamine amidotransferase